VEWRLAALIVALISITAVSALAVPPKRILFYYGYPSLFNGSESPGEAAQLFSQYDVVVLGAGLERPEHPDHGVTVWIISQAKGVAFYGYVTLAQPLSEVERRIRMWASMGVKGVFLDEAGMDFLVPRLHITPGEARRHQRAAVEYAHSLGLRVALNSWMPGDLLDPAGGEPGLNLSPSDSLLVESLGLDYGKASPELERHAEAWLRARNKTAAQIWCLTTTGARSSWENRLLAYTVLASHPGLCDGYAAQEDLGEDSTVFNPFASRMRGYRIDAAVYTLTRRNASKATLAVDKAIRECRDTVVFRIILGATPVPRPGPITPSDDQLAAAIKYASRRARVGLWVDVHWAGETGSQEFSRYASLLYHYASLLRDNGGSLIVVDTRVSPNYTGWRCLLGKLRSRAAIAVVVPEPTRGHARLSPALTVADIALLLPASEPARTAYAAELLEEFFGTRSIILAGSTMDAYSQPILAFGYAAPPSPYTCPWRTPMATALIELDRAFRSLLGGKN